MKFFCNQHNDIQTEKLNISFCYSSAAGVVRGALVIFLYGSIRLSSAAEVSSEHHSDQVQVHLSQGHTKLSLH